MIVDITPDAGDRPQGRPSGTERARLLPESRLVSVAFLIGALRRRWKLCVIAGVVGFLGALALTKSSPATPSATTTLFLRHPSQTDPGRAMGTAVELAKSRAVAERAIARAGLRSSVSGLVASHTVRSLSVDLLQVTAFGVNDADAVRRADALAAALLEFRASELALQAAAVNQALQDRAAALRAELDIISSAIPNAPATSSATPSTPAGITLGVLLTRRASVQQQLAGIVSQIDDRTLATSSVVGASHVIDPATPDPLPGRRALVTNLMAGVIACGSLGMGIVVVQEVFWDRVRRRRDVMAAMGAPVLVSLGGLRLPIRSQRRVLKRHLAKPRHDVDTAVWHLRALVENAGSASTSVVLVSVASDGPAAFLVGALVADLVRDGKRVLVEDYSRQRVLRKVLRIRPDTPWPRGSAGPPGAVTLTAPALDLARAPLPHAGQVDDEGQPEGEADVVVALAALDPAVGAWHLSGRVSSAVAVVTAGRSRANALESASRMIRAAGIEMHSALLVDADPDDDTVGLPNAPIARLTQALDFRARA